MADRTLRPAVRAVGRDPDDDRVPRCDGLGAVLEGAGIRCPPGLLPAGFLLLIFGLTVVSAGVHEFGHAAACRYGGATPGTMGFGLYIVFPAFYTDVTDSYRLDRRHRIWVDLGGLYFNAILCVVSVALWWATGWDALLLLVGTQVLQMLRQLTPVIRADGYHILADLTGVPDLFAHLKPTVASIWPGNWGKQDALRSSAGPGSW